MKLKSVSEVQLAMQSGANLTKDKDGNYSLKVPGSLPVAVDPDVVSSILEHPTIEWLGKNSEGDICYGLSFDVTLDGTRPQVVQR